MTAFSSMQSSARTKLCYIFVGSLLLLRYCNRLVPKNDEQAALKEDDFWDNFFKILK
jgi:hypothetical protein